MATWVIKLPCRIQLGWEMEGWTVNSYLQKFPKVPLTETLTKDTWSSQLEIVYKAVSHVSSQSCKIIRT